MSSLNQNWVHSECDKCMVLTAHVKFKLNKLNSNLLKNNDRE